jgi:hypothetical protein
MHRHADICLGERRGIIGAVPGHRDKAPRGLLALDEAKLVLGFRLRHEVVETRLRGDRVCSHGVVPGHHDRVDAHHPQARDAIAAEVNIGKVIAAIWLRLDNVVVVAMAFIRAFIVKDGGANLGNFYRDLVRFTTRVLLPLSCVLSLFMIWQGSPQTLDAEVTARPTQGGEQAIAIGPVASLETIKHIGTNGGGFFNANAAHPYENPTPLTSLLLTASMALLDGVKVAACRNAQQKDDEQRDPNLYPGWHVHRRTLHALMTGARLEPLRMDDGK